MLLHRPVAPPPPPLATMRAVLPFLVSDPHDREPSLSSQSRSDGTFYEYLASLTDMPAAAVGTTSETTCSHRDSAHSVLIASSEPSGHKDNITVTRGG